MIFLGVLYMTEVLFNEPVIETISIEEMTLKQYQNYIKDRLQYIFPNTEVKSEWNAMADERNLNLYSPRIDVAVGPFATHESLEQAYDNIARETISMSFIGKLIEFSHINLIQYGDFVEPPNFEQVIYQNRNARCFMSVEIENMVSRKHLMGGAINASALGRVGIVIPWSDEKLRAFVRLFRYLQYLKLADKNTFNTTNLLIITKEQFVQSMEVDEV